MARELAVENGLFIHREGPSKQFSTGFPSLRKMNGEKSGNAAQTEQENSLPPTAQPRGDHLTGQKDWC